MANVEILINSPHAGNFTLQIRKFYPFEQYLEPERIAENHFSLQNKIRDVTFPQAYKYKGDVKLIAYIYPKQNLSEIYFFVGVLEFEIVYCDLSENKMYNKFFNGTVYYEFVQ